RLATSPLATAPRGRAGRPTPLAPGALPGLRRSPSYVLGSRRVQVLRSGAELGEAAGAAGERIRDPPEGAGREGTNGPVRLHPRQEVRLLRILRCVGDGAERDGGRGVHGLPLAGIVGEG